MKKITRYRHRGVAFTIATLSAAALIGCSAETDTTETVSINDPWVKSVDEGMTAAFGEFTNETDETLVLTSVDTEVSPVVELHETVGGADGAPLMQELEGGFVIQPQQTLVLEPGGDHIMLMGVTTPIRPGDNVDLVLNFDDGSSLNVTAVAKEFAGAQEEYVRDHSGHDHDHGDGEHHDDGESHHTTDH